MYKQARAILWAQWRGILHYYPRNLHAGALASGVFMCAWYGLMLFLAWGVFSLVSAMKQPSGVYDLLPIHTRHFYPGELTLAVGERIPTEGMTIRQADELTVRLRAAIEELQGSSVTLVGESRRP